MKRRDAALGAGLALGLGAVARAASCERPVYLSFDTGHMGNAEAIAAVLERLQVPATFFLAAEPTQQGGHSLDAQWAPFWRRLAASGRHDFGSHTWDHAIWERDLASGAMRFRIQAGQQLPRWVELDGPAYCARLQRVADHVQAMTGQAMARIFRAPLGRTSARLLAAAQACGWAHVPWTRALGDDWPVTRASNASLLQQALTQTRAGDVVLAHLGIWSRQPPLLPDALEPLIVGLKARGLCFAPLRDHPKYRLAFER